jgi:RNA polymerase sigma-70 factor (ECF subfamily)
MANQTDAELVQVTREGGAEAYGELVARYQGHVYGLAYSFVGQWEDAQDIAQEAFIRAYCNLDQLQDPSRFAPWLRRVTFSVAVNWVKAFRPRLFAQLDGRVDLDSLEIPDFRPGPPEVVEKRELAEAVRRAVESLPAKYRVPLAMFHLNGLSYQKVADFLDIPLGTAKSLISRARAKLKDSLAPYMAEEMTPMVQEVFNEHKLPADFGLRVIVEKKEMLLVGAVSYGGDIGQLWERFSPREKDIKHAVEGAWWELHVWPQGHQPGQPYYVMVGVEVTRLEGVPDDLFVKPLPAGRYAVFPHRPGLGKPNHGYDELNQRIDSWLDTGPYKIARTFSLQLYDARFKGMSDPESEQDLLIPVEPKG